MSINLDAARLATTPPDAHLRGAATLPAAGTTNASTITSTEAQRDAGLTGVSNVVTDAAKWTLDHMGLIGAVVGTASLIAAIPLAHSPAAAAEAGAAVSSTFRSRLAARIAGTRVGAAGVDAVRSGATAALDAVRATRVGAGALEGAARGWTKLRVAREAIGATDVGRMLIKAQGPLYMAGTAIGVVNLSRDAYDWTQGRGNLKKTLLDTLAVLPAAGDLVKRVASARAAATEAAAATEVASALGHAQAKTASAMVTAADELAAPAPIIDTIADASSRAGAVSSTASRTASEVGGRARVLVADAAVPDAGTFVVRDLKAQVDVVEATTARARDVASSTSAATDGIEETLTSALHSTAHARRVLDDATSASVRLTSTARSAERLQGVAANTSLTAGLANNTAVLSHSTSTSTDANASGQGIARAVLGKFLAFNAAAGK